MTQAEIDRNVSAVTGESMREVRHRGFSLADPLTANFDPEPLMLRPNVVDWDELQSAQIALFQRRSRNPGQPLVI